MEIASLMARMMDNSRQPLNYAAKLAEYRSRVAEAAEIVIAMACM